MNLRFYNRSKVPLGGVIKIAVTEGEIVEDEQILLELDTTAVRSKLKALKIVQSQIKLIFY